MSSGKTLHIRSYADVEHVFMSCFPELILTQVKAVHKIHCEPKLGTVLVELENGIGIRFSAMSMDDSPNRNHKVTIFYETELIPSKHMEECLTYAKKRAQMRKNGMSTSAIKLPEWLHTSFGTI